MMNRHKIFAFSLLFLFVFNCFCSLSASAATEAHIERVFNKIAAEEGFLPSIYEAGKLFADRGVTDDYIDSQIKDVIRDTINVAVELKRTGNITEDDFFEKMKETARKTYMGLNAIILAVFFEAFPESTIADALAGRLPSSLAPLFNTTMNEARVLLFNENISDTPDYRFLDIETHLWAKEAILSLADAGVIDGMTDFRFEPESRITREQFVKLMAVVCELDIENVEAMKSEFWDVPKEEWYYPYVTAMADAGYVTGFGEGEFGTEQFITRQDIAVLIYRIGLKTEKLAQNLEKHEFVDNQDVWDYASEAVNLLYSYKIITGTPENYFNPQETATRAEAAQMIYKFYNIYISNQVF